MAGYKTDHVGEGRRRYHGGATPTKHGLYSQLSCHRLADRIRKLREDPDLLEFRDRIALQAAVIEDYLAGVGTPDHVTAADARTLNDLVEASATARASGLSRTHEAGEARRRFGHEPTASGSLRGGQAVGARRGVWHAWRRKWAAERKEMPIGDVAAAGGWRDTQTLLRCYQQSDEATLNRVFLEAPKLRSRGAGGTELPHFLPHPGKERMGTRPVISDRPTS